MLVGTEHADDAALVQFAAGESRAVVLTADVIAPIVDGAHDFGGIAAANSLSDVYAMGGEPRFAMNLVFFPDEQLPLEVLREIMAGAAAVCHEAQVPVVGGHSVRNDDLKFGLSVTGEVAADSHWANTQAQAGQMLVLSKALGTGILGTALKGGHLEAHEAKALTASMLRLNAKAAQVGRAYGATSATDVTGFSLLGHLRNILRGSELRADLQLDALPLLPGAMRCYEAGYIPGGSRGNRKQLEPSFEVQSSADDSDARIQLATDAQTSGGLLLCIPAANAHKALQELLDSGHDAAIIGELQPPKTGRAEMTLL